MTKPEHLDTEHSAALTGVLARCPALRAVRQHVAEFAAMMRELDGERLDDWIHAVEPTTCPLCTPSWPACAATTPRSPPD